ncbi:hypothetical protein VNO80_15458 [Phaseolus coccineus]|uniref:Uncharacterized protein n=1 Tax=Phaseolus coccineus TaxID=3886 RepID=A0AAN9MK96_PHACN
MQLVSYSFCHAAGGPVTSGGNVSCRCCRRQLVYAVVEGGWPTSLAKITRIRPKSIDSIAFQSRKLVQGWGAVYRPGPARTFADWTSLICGSP